LTVKSNVQNRTGVFWAREILDQHINFLISKLYEEIDQSVEDVERDISRRTFRRRASGVGAVLGAAFEIYADIVNKNKTFQNFGGVDENMNIVVNDIYSDVFGYGDIFVGRGLGYGLILLVGLPDEELTCGNSDDFIKLLHTYNLDNGINNFFPSHNAAGPSIMATQISEFGVRVKGRLDCVISKETSVLSAAEVGWALEELIAALNLRLELETH